MATPIPVFAAARRPRVPLRVDLDAGVMVAGGRTARFDPAMEHGVELAYLRLVRQLRDVHREPSFVLRSDDVEALADALREEPVGLLDRLGGLMGASVIQRRSMVATFLAGGLLIAVATGAAALVPGDTSEPTPAPDTTVQAPEDDADVEAPAVSGSTPPAPTGGPTSDPDVGETTADSVAPAETPGSAGAPAGSGTTGRTPSSTPPEAPAPSAPPTPDPPSGAPTPPAAEVSGDGAPDRWTWDGPEIVQPGADIDIPDDPEIVQPGADIDIPDDDDTP